MRSTLWERACTPATSGSTRAQVLLAAPGDVIVAEGARGPLILARSGEHKTVAFGFHPGRAATRSELATPLLFANILRWMCPEVFSGWELNGGGAGTLPEVADGRWEPSSEVLRGLPHGAEAESATRDLWRILALLGLVGLLAEWILFGGKPVTVSPASVLKLAALCSILVALAGPRLPVRETRMAVVALADTSSSVPDRDLERASQLISAMESARGRNWMRVLPFARSAREITEDERAAGKLRHTTGEAGEATDMELALREALALLPSGMVPRIALISDGRENRGSIARGAALARQLGVPLDTLALPGRPQPDFMVEVGHHPPGSLHRREVRHRSGRALAPPRDGRGRTGGGRETSRDKPGGNRRRGKPAAGACQHQ